MNLLVLFLLAVVWRPLQGSVGSESDYMTLCVIILEDHDESTTRRQQQQPSAADQSTADTVWLSGNATLPSHIKINHVIQSSEHFTAMETRAIIPLLPKLYREYGSMCMWFMIATPQTRPQFHLHGQGTGIASVLANYTDPNSEMYFLGLSLQDKVPTITHHFLYHKNAIDYPLLCSGVLLSNMVLSRVTHYYDNYTPNFIIDPVFELSLFLKYMRFPSVSELHEAILPQADDGVTLTHHDMFCSGPQSAHECFTYCSKDSHCHHSSEQVGGQSLSTSDVAFAVKTCHKNHDTRLPVMWKTWAGNPSPLDIRYFSDVADERFGTIDVGVKNTERGHCSKLLSILHHVYSDMSVSSSSSQWLMVCDDDTLLSVPRLLEYLACYDPDKPVIIGEMYGYKSSAADASGYLYPTGGSGIVFSRAAVGVTVGSGVTCPADDYPDDMFIGLVAMLKLKIKLVHSPLFHQDQPQSYHPLLLQSSRPPISFHRHKPHDPFDIYNEYLKEHDKPMDTTEASTKTEL